jgi:membrane protein DedA with SNARE-associated domain
MLGILHRRRRTVILTMLILTIIWLLIFGGQLYQAARQLFDEPVASTGEQPWFLEAIDNYGLPLVFGMVTVAAAGVPLPVSWLLLAVGASAAQGNYSIAAVVGTGFAAAVIGDHLGYLIGWSGGRWLVRRMARMLSIEEQLPKAQDALRRRGWVAVFLSRWLLLPLGSPCNWLCGSLGYPLRKFFVADVLGEALYVGLCVFLGVTFSEQIEGVAGLIGKTGAWLVGLALAALLVWRLFIKPTMSPLATAPTHAIDRA